MLSGGPRGSLSTFDGSSDDLCNSAGDLESPSWSGGTFTCPCKRVNSQLGHPGGPRGSRETCKGSYAVNGEV